MSSQVANEKRRSYRADIQIPVTYVVEGQAEAHSALQERLGRRHADRRRPGAGAGQRIAYVRFALPNELVRDVRFEREVVQRTLRGRCASGSRSRRRRSAR